MTRLPDTADTPTAAGGLVSLLGLALLGSLILTTLVVRPALPIVAMEVPAAALAVGLLVVGVQTARGELVADRDARRLAGWALGGGLLFLGVGAWLRGLEAVSGQAIPHLATMTLSITTLGAFVGAVVGLYDADRRAQSRALREREERLDAQNDRLEEFASIVSHDLRNPLNVAQGRLDLALAEYDGEHLEAVDRSLDRMEALIEDLLALAREGEAEADREPVALDAVVDRSWETVDTTGGRLRNEVEGGILADESQLMEFLENLFRNSVEHGSASGAGEETAGEVEGEEVTIRVGVLEDGFFVEDDGPGIPPEDRSQVFEPGFSTSPDGTGFGLHIVRRIAETHGWSIRVTEGDAGGARFEVTGVEWVDDEPAAETDDPMVVA
ncbi:MAG: sensor histidine kinase [Halolamina sp.]